MIYELNLHYPIGYFRVINITKGKHVKEKLESIISFEERLSYYNIEIRSLSTYEKKGGQIYFQWGLPDQKIKVFCNCKDCRSKPDFNKEEETIYQQLRTKEVERIVTGIGNQSTYKEKLSFLFETKGYNPDLTPAVWSDHEEEPIIDLRPKTREQIIIYNQFVIDEFNKRYRQGNGFSENYKGFNCEEEKARLHNSLSKAIDKKKLLEFVKGLIEKHFNYPACLEFDNREHHISKHVLVKIDKKLEQEGHIKNQFAKLCLGVPIELNKYTLDSNTYGNYTHVSEIFKFYEHIYKLLETPALLKLFEDEKQGLNIEPPQKSETKKQQETLKELCEVPFIGSLLNQHLHISEKILDAYFSLVPQPIKREDVSNHYVGKLNHYFQPYKVSIYGAYPLMKYWEMVEYKMKNVDDESGYFKNWQKEKVFEAMKDYAKGFQHGFDNFITEVIDNKNSLSSSEAIRLQKIKDYVFNWLINSPGFSETHGKGIEKVFSNWYNDGIQGGYYYKAWYLILDNHLAFAPLFKESEPQTFEDLKAFFDQLNQDDATVEESFKKGFKRLHEYINKNVHNDVRADLPTLQLRETNLVNWKVQLEHDEALNNERWKQKTEKIISHINGALEVIRLRIKRKEQAFPTEQTEKKTSPTRNELSLPEIQNNFDNIDINAIYDHFKRGLVDKKYFSEAELMKYLKAAFQVKQVPENRFKFTNSPTKEKVMEVFYRYYRDVASKPHGKQLQYAALLGDYFAGYNTRTISTNFSKSVH
jgi:hypothetical protein